MSNTYLVEQNGQRGIVTVKGFVPRGVIARVPDDINPEDFEFVETQTVPGDEEMGTEETVIAIVNRKRKATALAQREAQAIEREAKEKAKRDDRETLLTKLANSNAQGPLADLIRLTLLNEGIEIPERNPGIRN